MSGGHTERYNNSGGANVARTVSPESCHYDQRRYADCRQAKCHYAQSCWSFILRKNFLSKSLRLSRRDGDVSLGTFEGFFKGPHLPS